MLEAKERNEAAIADPGLIIFTFPSRSIHKIGEGRREGGEAGRSLPWKHRHDLMQLPKNHKRKRKASFSFACSEGISLGRPIDEAK